jgi:hypothetical protein
MAIVVVLTGPTLPATLVPSLAVATAPAGTTVIWVCTKKGAAPASPEVKEELAIPACWATLEGKTTPFVLPPDASIDPSVPECVALVSELLTEECARLDGETSWPIFFLPDRAGCAALFCACASKRMPNVAPYNEPSPSRGASANIGLIQPVVLRND